MSINCLYCTAEFVLFARFRASKEQLRLVDFRAREGDLRTADGFLQLVRDLKLPPGWKRAVHLVGGILPVLPKVVSVPVVGAGAQREATSAEVRRALPFTPDEMVWDHVQVYNDGVEQELAVVASRREAVTGLVRRVRESGLNPLSVQVTPMTVLAATEVPGDLPQASLIIYAEPSAIHLVFRIGKRLRLRSLRVEPQDADDPSRAGQILLEIRRMLRSSPGPERGGAPGVLLAGSAMPRLREQLTHLPDLGIRDWPDLDLDVPEHLATAVATWRQHLPPLVGAGMAARKAAIDLLPAVFTLGEVERYRPKWRWRSGAALLVASGAATLLGAWRERERARFELSEVREAIVDAEQQRRQILEEIEASAGVKRRTRVLEKLVNDRTTWIHVLADLQARLVAVEDVWFDSLSLVPPSEPLASSKRGELESDSKADQVAPTIPLQIAGRMVDRRNPLRKVSSEVRQRVDRLVENLADSPYIAAVTEMRFDTSEPGVLRFAFAVDLESGATR